MAPTGVPVRTYCSYYLRPGPVVVYLSTWNSFCQRSPGVLMSVRLVIKQPNGTARWNRISLRIQQFGILISVG